MAAWSVVTQVWKKEGAKKIRDKGREGDNRVERETSRGEKRESRKEKKSKKLRL